MRHLFATVTLACLVAVAGCPADPGATADTTRMQDPRNVAEAVGCWMNPMEEGEAFVLADCVPMLHPVDLDVGAWETHGVFDFDVEPIPMLGGMTYRYFYTAGGPTFAQSTGFAQSDNGVDVRRFSLNPVLTPPIDEEIAQIACTAIDRRNGTYHAWYRRENGVLYHATSTEGREWTKDTTGAVLSVKSDVQGGLNTLLTCDAWFTGSTVHMLVGGLFGDPATGNVEFAIGETSSEDGFNFQPVDAPTFQGNETIEWQVGGVGSPSVLNWGSDQYMFFVGATEYEEPDDPFLEPFMSRIGVARRVGGEGDWVYVRDLPLTFPTASPSRVRVVLAGEWAMVYMRDLYHGAVVHEDPFDALGLMLVHMPELEGGS